MPTVRNRSHHPVHPAKTSRAKLAGFALAIAAGATAFIGGLVALERPIRAELKQEEQVTRNVTQAELAAHTEEVLRRYDDCVTNGAAIC